MSERDEMLDAAYTKVLNNKVKGYLQTTYHGKRILDLDLPDMAEMEVDNIVAGGVKYGTI